MAEVAAFASGSVFSSLSGLLGFLRAPTRREKLVIYVVIGMALFLRVKQGKRKPRTSRSAGSSNAPKAVPFPEQLSHLVRICLPGRHVRLPVLGKTYIPAASRQLFNFVAFATVLVARTVLSLLVSRLDGYIVAELVSQRYRSFTRGIVVWLLVAVPSCLINALIRYYKSELGISFRERLVQYTRDLYFADKTFYRVAFSAHSEAVAAGCPVDHLPPTSDPATSTSAAGCPSSAAGTTGSTAASASAAAAGAVTPATAPPPLSALTNLSDGLTTDIGTWCGSFAELVSSLGKPLVDIVIFSTVLIRTLGLSNQLVAMAVVHFSGVFLRTIRPPIGDFVKRREQLESDLRTAHTRVVVHSEEIAFLDGDARERGLLAAAFAALRGHSERLLRMLVPFNAVEDFVTKYVWNALGFAQIAVSLAAMRNTRAVAGSTASAGGMRDAVAHNGTRGNDTGSNAGFYVTARDYMVRNGDAAQRLMEAIQTRYAELQGYTDRVYDVVTTLERVAKTGAGRPTPITTTQAAGGVAADATGADAAATGGAAGVSAGGAVAVAVPVNVAATAEDPDSDAIVFENVTIRTPTGHLLTRGLTLRVASGERVLIRGPNGVGKSSMFRVLHGLWKVYTEKEKEKEHPAGAAAAAAAAVSDADGAAAAAASHPRRPRIIAPRPRDGRPALFFLPQRPLLLPGAPFRDQVIYPDTPQEAARKHNGRLVDGIPLVVNGVINDAALAALLLTVDFDPAAMVLRTSEGAAAASAARATTSQTADADVAAGPPPPPGTTWKAVFDRVDHWADRLSGGEKQKVGLARVFYHRPLFAVLDECTAAVSLESEEVIFRALASAGVSVLTITHRDTLNAYHDRVVTFNLDGTYTIERLHE